MNPIFCTLPPQRTRIRALNYEQYAGEKISRGSLFCLWVKWCASCQMAEMQTNKIEYLHTVCACVHQVFEIELMATRRLNKTLRLIKLIFGRRLLRFSRSIFIWAIPAGRQASVARTEFKSLTSKFELIRAEATSFAET